MSTELVRPLDPSLDRPLEEHLPRPHRLRVTHPAPEVDLATARRAATALLTALGLPVDGPDMAETPRRLVDAYAELLAVPDFDLTTFDNGSGYDELVLVRDIPVRSLCPPTGSSGSPSWRAPWSSSPVACRPRSG